MKGIVCRSRSFLGEKRWVGRERERERKGQEGELLIFRPREKREARSKEEVVVDDWGVFSSLFYSCRSSTLNSMSSQKKCLPFISRSTIY
jgi:hypothetical protein